MNLSQVTAPQQNMDYLDYAGNMIDRHDLRDISAPGLLEVTGVSQHGMATASGLSDYDYQNLSTLSLGHKQLNQISTVNKIPIPAEILEHFKHIKCHCMMGLFPEIGRAWLTIDSEIYIWTYEQSRDVAYYDGLNSVIISVGLVTPKPGVFIADVKYLLVLTTISEIVVLGVTFNDSSKTLSSPIRNGPGTPCFQEMQLMNKPIFILNSDNISMNVIEGNDNGRIFLGGQDGCLYEIYYQAESSWFGKRCKKINHSQGIVSTMIPGIVKLFIEPDPIVKIAIDDSRQLLYVLTDKGSIEAWEMSPDSMRRITRISQNDIAIAAGNILKTVDQMNFKPIKAICPISADDCPNLHLLAITSSGVRLFFSTNQLIVSQNFGQQQQQAQPQLPLADHSKPQGLYLLHVRVPPGFTSNTSSVNKPKQVHKAHYKEGTLLLVSTPQQEQDNLWSLSSAPFPNRPYLAESMTILPLDGIVWSLADIRDRFQTKVNSILRNAQKPKKIVLLTNQGAHIISLLKPADILQQLLLACHGAHHEAVKAFFQAQTEREACTTSLLLACSEQFRGTDIAMWAAQAFMLYGGEPGYQHPLMQQRTIQSSAGLDRSSPQIFMSTPMPARGPNMSMQSTGPINYPLSPIGNHTTQYSTTQYSMLQNQTVIGDLGTVVYSSKHDGLYTYVSRLLRPIWQKRCVDQHFCSTLTKEDCIIILEDLYAIKGFLDVNSVNELSSTMRSSYVNQSNLTNGFGQLLHTTNANDQRNIVEQAQAEEKRSLMALTYFIKHTCEVIALWKILNEHQFQLLANTLNKDQKNTLAACTFRELTLSRADTCAFLIVALINTYLKDNASVSAISSKLREVCPNLYRHEDAVSFKATEILMMSKNCTIFEERDEKLRTALQLCKDAAPNLPLQNICQQFVIAGFYEGVIELSATCAAKSDPEGFAIHFYNKELPVEDREGFAAHASRMNCYKEVKLMLDHVYQSICNSTENAEFSRYPCSADTRDQNANQKIIEIVSIAMQVNDKLLHIAIYEWLLEHEMFSELLSLVDQSLGEFLRRLAVLHPQNLTIIDLLWKYYEKNGHHSLAAKILDSLATMKSESVPLVQRIEYLARAVMCMRNDNLGYSITSGILLRDLEDKLEIARVQKTVLDALSSVPERDDLVEKAIYDLNYTLYDITQLYQDFADPFNLWECKLAILNCSHHNDPLLIESVWGQILNKSIEGPGSREEKCTRLLSKVQSLIKEFGESGHCFPLAFLVRELEIKACQLRLNEGTIPDALVTMELEIEFLIGYYARMISMNERVWANEGNEWHLVHSSIRIVDRLVNTSNAIGSRSKRRIIGKAQDLLSACLNLCYPKPGTDRLQHQLRELQSRLQRVL